MQVVPSGPAAVLQVSEITFLESRISGWTCRICNLRASWIRDLFEVCEVEGNMEERRKN